MLKGRRLSYPPTRFLQEKKERPPTPGTTSFLFESKRYAIELELQIRERKLKKHKSLDRRGAGATHLVERLLACSVHAA
jgi:hypothetical protein